MQHTRTFVIRAVFVIAAALASAPSLAAQTAPAVVISPVPMLQFFDASGRPLAGGCVATYAAGTTTPLATWTDSTGATANPNPVLLDAAGRAAIWIKVPAIKYVVKSKGTGGTCSLVSGTTLYTTDNIQDQALRLRADMAGTGAGQGADMMNYKYSAAATTRTVQDRLRDAVSVLDFGVVADGTGAGGTDQSAKIQTALNAAAGGTLIFPAQLACYTVWVAPIIPNNTTVNIQAGACVQKKAGPPPSSCASGCTAVFMAGSGTAPASNIWIVGGGTIDGNAGNISGISGDGFNQGIAFAGCTNCGTQDIAVKNAYTGGISIACWGAAPATGLGNNVQILNTIITGSRRNNLENLCGTNTVMRGGQLSNATGGSLSLGYDLEPFAAGQLTTGAVLDGVEIFGNRDGGINAAPVYDLAPNVTLLNVNCHDNGGTECLASTNFYASGPSGTLTITGGAYSGGTVAAVLVSGWMNVNASGESTSGAPRGFLVGSNVRNAVLGPGRISGTTQDLSVDGPNSKATVMGVQFGCGDAGATQACIQPGEEANVIMPMTGFPFGWTDHCIAFWPSASPRTGGMNCAAPITLNENANPYIRIADGSGGIGTIQAIPGAQTRVGSVTNTPACLSSNNACRVTADGAGNVIVPGIQDFANNAAAVAAGLTVRGTLYHITGTDQLGVVH